METTIFELISNSIESIGILNTIAAVIITVGIGWTYSNGKKQKKILENTVDVQNRTILDAINSQNAILYEIQRISLGIAELTSQQSGRLDGMVEIIISLLHDKNNNANPSESKEDKKGDS